MNAEVKLGYQKTNIGIFPADWKIKACSTISELITVGIVIKPTQYYVAEGVPAFRSANIRESGLTMLDLVYISKESNRLLSKSQTRAGDVLTVRTGYPGTSSVVREVHAGANCIDILITRPSNSVIPDFLNYWINSPFGKDQVLKNQGGLAQKHFNVGDLRNLLVALPSLDEQERISSALLDMDALISGLDQLIAKKRDIKQATMQQLLTGKMRLPGFAGSWVKKAIGELGDISGAGVDKKISEGERPVRLLNYMDVYRSGFLRPSTLSHVVTAREDQAKRCSVLRGDIFFTPTSEVRSDIGRSAVALDDAQDVVYSYHLVRLRLRMDMDLRFRSYVFKARDFLDRASIACEGSGTRYVITLPRFRALQVWFPLDLNEQKAIADVLFEMDSEIEALEDRRDKARLLKQGMMQELLTGRIRLV